MSGRQEQNPLDLTERLLEQVEQLLSSLRRELYEQERLLQQSQQEVEKLSRKNASITAELQKMQSHTDEFSRHELRMGYEAALEAQQRLYLMSGKVEKIQNQIQQLKMQSEWLESFRLHLYTLQESLASSGRGLRPGEGVEMIIQAQEAERQRLSRQMHDGPAQALSNFILQTEIAMRLFEIDPAKAKEELESLKLSATQAFQKVRDFIFELRPMMLDDLGLVPTVRRYVEALQNVPGVSIQLTLGGVERRLEPYLEVMVFRAIQELLGNAVRHSQASEVRLHLDLGDNHL
ncbi:MAG: histidine kinase, partial [Anaerolineales bacterium]|nr:histidine kinase [Anaerolineales bacterium]MDW8447004.1 histidine kinase [Anaerolineales bacterium]